ncbi:MAG: hypothetical protein RI907_1381 [Pseudomonadota bacterium]|jgi:hypothetical protein
MVQTPSFPLSRLLAPVALASLTLLAACGQGDSETPDGNATSQAQSLAALGKDVPIAYAKRVNTISVNPTNGAPTAPGGDLMIRPLSSPVADEYNITERFTKQGDQRLGDVTSPQVSYDGKKLLFAMRCPASNTATISQSGTEVKACTGRWNIWEYDMSAGSLTGGTFRRLTSSTTDDDVDPTYLPAGRGVVFTSNRQAKSHLKQFTDADGTVRSYYALDEYERERVFNLHTMDADGAHIAQISFNQSHDRSPVVRQNGEIMFSRWDHVGGRNHFKIFRVKPDGTDLFVVYGAHSEGNSFLHPREMDPEGAYKGQVASDLMPLSGSRGGGALVFVDVSNYSEQNTPVSPNLPGLGGQSQPTAQALSTGRDISYYGRVTTPFPLWDGTDRVLLSWTPCQVSRSGQAVSCAALSEAERARLSEEGRTREEILNDELKDNVAPSYALWMFQPADKSWKLVASPPSGYMYTHPVALQARAEPSVTEPTPVDADLAAEDKGLIEVRSVYDTDQLGRMGDPVLVPSDLGEGCTVAIPKVAPTDAQDTRAQIADLASMKDPANRAYGCAPARFIRVFRAVAPPDGSMGMRAAIGETDFEMQQILGYAPIEPDGSFKLKIPADTPIGLAVVDASGRAFQTHTNWIQVRPGERRTCDGCHSPRRGGAINSGAVVNAVPDAWLPAMKAHELGETMAGTRTRLFPSALLATPDMVFSDIWADPSKATPRAAISLTYSGLAVAPTNGIVNYPEHIQPIWTRSRGTDGVDTCTNCHNASDTRFDLSATTAGSGRLTSYERLMMGDPLLDSNGKPVFTLREGIPMLNRKPALVDTMASEGDAAGLTRKSRLAEILWGQTLMAGASARTTYPTPPAQAPNHANLLNASEKRLLAEWMDLGGKYYNDPYNAGAGVRTITGLSETAFTQQVFPILKTTCANGCHQALGSNASGASFRDNRFVLTGDAEGDYNVTLSMINNACAPGSNPLLSRPSTNPHPAGATAAVLSTTSAAYATIANWVQTGCPSR